MPEPIVLAAGRRQPTIQIPGGRGLVIGGLGAADSHTLIAGYMRDAQLRADNSSGLTHDIWQFVADNLHYVEVDFAQHAGRTHEQDLAEIESRLHGARIIAESTDGDNKTKWEHFVGQLENARRAIATYAANDLARAAGAGSTTGSQTGGGGFEMPTWGWYAIAGAGVLAIGGIAYARRKKRR